MNKTLKFWLCLWFFGCVTAQGQEIVFHPSHEPAKQNAPYSDAVEANGFLFLAGQIGMDQKTRTLVPGGIKVEVEQTIKNIEDVLKHHGLTLDHVVKCTVILSTMEDFAALNEVYVKYFPKKPARTTFAASGIAFNGKVEIEVVAVKN